MIQSISKKLSSNDVGDTGSKQAGILVPKEQGILSLFPNLGNSTKNPRATIVVREVDGSARWEFKFIYYNGRLFGGTRNEYRLTCMTKYLRSIGAKDGDELVFTKDHNGSIQIEYLRASNNIKLDDSGILVLGSGWKIIKKGEI